MAARIRVTPQSFCNHSVVPFVQNCGFHWDQKRDIPRSRTGAPDSSVTWFPTTFRKPYFLTTEVEVSTETVVVGAEVVEVDPEVDEVVASLAQVVTSNAIIQVELEVTASHGIIWHPLNLLAIEI